VNVFASLLYQRPDERRKKAACQWKFMGKWKELMNNIVS